jgi:hypothetical protein
VQGLSSETLFLVMMPDLSSESKLDICRKNGFEPRNVEYLPNPFARELAVKNGQGFSVGGTDENCHFPAHIRLFPAAEGSNAGQHMLLLWRKNALSPMTKALIDSFPEC